MTDRTEPRQITHTEGCWSWGPAHYLCAYREIGRLRVLLSAAQATLECAAQHDVSDCREVADEISAKLREVGSE